MNRKTLLAQIESELWFSATIDSGFRKAAKKLCRNLEDECWVNVKRFHEEGRSGGLKEKKAFCLKHYEQATKDKFPEQDLEYLTNVIMNSIFVEGAPYNDDIKYLLFRYGAETKSGKTLEEVIRQHQEATMQDAAP